MSFFGINLLFVFLAMLGFVAAHGSDRDALRVFIEAFAANGLAVFEFDVVCVAHGSVFGWLLD
jgi:hypothetical protein